MKINPALVGANIVRPNKKHKRYKNPTASSAYDFALFYVFYTVFYTIKAGGRASRRINIDLNTNFQTKDNKHKKAYRTKANAKNYIKAFCAQLFSPLTEASI